MLLFIGAIVPWTGFLCTLYRGSKAMLSLVLLCGCRCLPSVPRALADLRSPP